MLRLILFTLFLVPCSLFGQISLKGASDIGELRWWLGLKTGVTFSQVKVLDRFSALSNPGTESKKKYSALMSNMGQTVGAIFGFAFNEYFLVTFQPAYSSYKYTYTTNYVWQNKVGDAYSLSTKQSHRLGYIELPITLMFRKQIGNIEPYVNIGGYYGIFVGGRKKITYTEGLFEGGIYTEEPKKTEVIGMANFLMKSQMGITGGVGVAYTIQYFRLGLECTYRQGLYNIIDEKSRYSDRHLVGKFFEIPDNLKLNQLEVTLNMFMPVDNLIHLHSSQKSKGGARR